MTDSVTEGAGSVTVVPACVTAVTDSVTDSATVVTTVVTVLPVLVTALTGSVTAVVTMVPSLRDGRGRGAWPSDDAYDAVGAGEARGSLQPPGVPAQRVCLLPPPGPQPGLGDVAVLRRAGGQHRGLDDPGPFRRAQRPPERLLGLRDGKDGVGHHRSGAGRPGGEELVRDTPAISACPCSDTGPNVTPRRVASSVRNAAW